MFEKLNSKRLFHLFRHRSIHNFFFLFVIQSSNLLISLIAMPLLIQRLGVEQFGLVNLSLSVIFLVNVLVTFGYNLSGPREVAVYQENTGKLSELVSKVFFSKLLLALFATVVLLGLTVGFGFFGEYKIILVFSLFLLFSEASQSTWFFQGMEKMKWLSIANVAGKLLYLLALILWVHSANDARWPNFFLGASALGFNLLLIAYIHFDLKVKLIPPGWKAIVLSWKDNFTLFLSGIASHLAINGGLIILSFFASAAVLGMFSLAERVTMVLRIVPTLIAQAIYPNASKLFHKDLNEFHRFLKKVYGLALGVSLLVSLTFYVLAPQVIWFLSKSDLEESVGFLRILSFVPFLASLNIANMILILVGNLNKLLLHSTWTFGCFMIVSCTVFSYLFGGEGLAYGLLATELFIFISCTILLKLKKTSQFEAFYKRLLFSHYPA